MRILLGALFAFIVVTIFTKIPDLLTQFVWGAIAAALAVIVCSLPIMIKRTGKRTPAQHWIESGFLAAGAILLTLGVQYAIL